MCFFEISTTDDLLDACQSDTEKYTHLKSSYTRYRKRDILFLYALAFAMICNSIGIIFSMVTADCSDSNKKQFNDVIRNECLFMSSFSLVILAMRLWFFRGYLQQPVIALWSQHELSASDIAMNVFYYIFGLACFGTYIVMFYELMIENYVGAIITTCVVCGLCVWTSLWYKLIIMNNIKHAINICRTQRIPTATVVNSNV